MQTQETADLRDAELHELLYTYVTVFCKLTELGQIKKTLGKQLTPAHVASEFYGRNKA